MPSRDWRLRITDILQAVQDIEQFTQGMTFEEFSKNKMVVQSVLYSFVIIGEASANIPEEIQSLDPTIPGRKMSDMRNVMAHEYFQVNLSIVWQTIHRNLPPILPKLEKLIEKPYKLNLFGLNNSNRDFSKAESWGKNQFNSSFPATLSGNIPSLC